MTGKILAAFIVFAALAAGGAIYYLQVYAYYDPVVANGTDDVVLTERATGEARPIPYDDFRAIDAGSSPIRYRSCFSTAAPVTELAARFEPYRDASPLVAPGWFDCFDADEVGAALSAGDAQAFLSVRNVHYGIDRVVAILPDGRGVAWHQINRCGAEVFDGRTPPEGCPPAPRAAADG